MIGEKKEKKRKEKNGKENVLGGITVSGWRREVDEDGRVCVYEILWRKLGMGSGVLRVPGLLFRWKLCLYP